MVEIKKELPQVFALFISPLLSFSCIFGFLYLYQDNLCHMPNPKWHPCVTFCGFSSNFTCVLAHMIINLPCQCIDDSYRHMHTKIEKKGEKHDTTGSSSLPELIGWKKSMN
jgi:hypothetical protein